MPSEQFTDIVVSRKKFNREIAEFRSLQDQYHKRGWFLVHAKFPHAMVILATPKIIPSIVLLGIAFDYTNYDAHPPSVRLVNPFTGVPYKNSELPTQLLRSLPARQLNVQVPEGVEQLAQQISLQPPPQPFMQAYGPDDIPFLCIAGVLEYHDHPAHSGDLWELHRPSGAGRLIRIIEIISKYGLETFVGFNVQMTPKIILGFGTPPV